jgi:hypothetical protein
MKRMLDELFPTPLASSPLRKQPTPADLDKQTISDGLQDLSESLGGWDEAVKYLWEQYGDSLIETMPADVRERLDAKAVEGADEADDYIADRDEAWRTR